MVSIKRKKKHVFQRGVKERVSIKDILKSWNVTTQSDVLLSCTDTTRQIIQGHLVKCVVYIIIVCDTRTKNIRGTRGKDQISQGYCVCLLVSALYLIKKLGEIFWGESEYQSPNYPRDNITFGWSVMV